MTFNSLECIYNYLYVTKLEPLETASFVHIILTHMFVSKISRVQDCNMYISLATRLLLDTIHMYTCINMQAHLVECIYIFDEKILK